jgi:hypothetical protein
MFCPGIHFQRDFCVQAATIISKVKHTLGVRGLQPSDLPTLGSIARGLLPHDLDELLENDDDVDDVADIIGDYENELSSSLVSSLTTGGILVLINLGQYLPSFTV